MDKDLCYFSSVGDIATIKHYLSIGISPDFKDKEGRSALHWSVDSDHIEVLELLLKSKANPNIQDFDGQTPLHYAATCDRVDAIKILLEHGANYNLSDNDGSTPKDISPSLFL